MTILSLVSRESQSGEEVESGGGGERIHGLEPRMRYGRLAPLILLILAPDQVLKHGELYSTLTPFL
jgi:hypothetical protein